jgi:replicative DNA helicase
MKQDKSLPQAVDLEEVVLGAILIASDAMIQVADFLKPEMFYNGKFAEVYRC